ncbi:efflux transporter outer membrane subunit [Phenylobacterium sp.]|uniref:efflux transporter outer membrane subunit n=1 Tax=Phenylobacterium sp. TaxID=1871053 RepID=UPI0035B3634E
MITRRACLRAFSTLTALSATGGVAACAVGRPYVAPQPELPAAFPAQAAGGGETAQSLASWWRGLGDPQLSACVERALKSNAELEIAGARIEQARAALDEARALSLPIGEAAATAGRGADSALGPEGRLLSALQAGRETDLYSGVLAVGWEADLFGRLKQAREARSALVESEAEKARATRVAVAAETARAYVVLRSLQQRKATLDARVGVAEQALRLAERRAAVGEGAVVEARKAQAQLAALQAAQPQLQTGLERTADALDLLQGAPLGESRALLAMPGELPAALPEAVLDAPAAVVARRPDVAAAERAVAAAHAGVRVALAQYYPSVSLGGLVGYSRTEPEQLFDPKAGLWLGGASVRWRILDWGRLNADLRSAKGREAEALATYRSTVEQAAAEIDAALASVRGSAERARRIAAFIESVEGVRRAAGRAHEVGEATLDPVLQADQELWQARDQGVLARTAALEASIDLYRALGAV